MAGADLFLEPGARGVFAVARCKRDQRTNRDLRKDSDPGLADKLAAGRKVLAAVTPEDDPRWLDFRADVPGDDVQVAVTPLAAVA